MFYSDGHNGVLATLPPDAAISTNKGYTPADRFAGAGSTYSNWKAK